MRTKLFGLALAASVLTLASCSKKESSGGGDSAEYTLDLRQPGVGSTLQGTFKIEMKMAMNVTDPNGTPQEKKDVNLQDEIVYRETILEWQKGRKKPSKSKILFEKWNRGKDGGIGDEGVRQRVLGREVLFQKIGYEYELRALDGQPLDQNVRIFLQERYNELIENFNARDFLPDKPVKTHTPWDIDVRKLLAAAMKAQGGSVPLDTRKAKGTGKLLNVTEKDGRKYGTIELRVDLGEMEMPKEPGLTLNTTGKMELVFNIEACIDGSKHDVKATAKMEFGIDAKHPKHGAMKMMIKLNLDIQEKETTIGQRSDDPAARKPSSQAKSKSEGRAGPSMPRHDHEEFGERSDDKYSEPYLPPGPSESGKEPIRPYPPAPYGKSAPVPAPPRLELDPKHDEPSAQVPESPRLENIPPKFDIKADPILTPPPPKR